MLKSPQKSSAKTVKSIKVSRGRLADGQPNPVDVHVGMRLLLRRKRLNYSQGRVAGMLGLTFQQIQKYAPPGSALPGCGTFPAFSGCRSNISFRAWMKTRSIIRR